MIIEYDSQTDSATFISYAKVPATTSDSQLSQADMLSSLYSTASEFSDPKQGHRYTPYDSYSTSHFSHQEQASDTPISVFPEGIVTMRGVVTKKKYKPVAKKVRPVIAELPEKFRIVRNIEGDPLAEMPTLNPNPPAFQPTQRYTQERRDALDNKHPDSHLSVYLTQYTWNR